LSAIAPPTHPVFAEPSCASGQVITRQRRISSGREVRFDQARVSHCPTNTCRTIRKWLGLPTDEEQRQERERTQGGDHHDCDDHEDQCLQRGLFRRRSIVERSRRKLRLPLWRWCPSDRRMLRQRAHRTHAVVRVAVRATDDGRAGAHVERRAALFALDQHARIVRHPRRGAKTWRSG
jgi:hypothetical protein